YGRYLMGQARADGPGLRARRPGAPEGGRGRRCPAARVLPRRCRLAARPFVPGRSQRRDRRLLVGGTTGGVRRDPHLVGERPAASRGRRPLHPRPIARRARGAAQGRRLQAGAWMRLHRALTLVVMIAISLVLIFAMTVYGIGTFSSGSLVALVVVLVAAAIAGVVFGWRRYFPGGRGGMR